MNGTILVTCTNASCLNATGDQCDCPCGGAGHGDLTRVRAGATRDRAAKRQQEVYGGPFGFTRTDDEPLVVRPQSGLAALSTDDFLDLCFND